MIKERISELQDKIIEVTESEQQREIDWKTNEQKYRTIMKYLAYHWSVRKKGECGAEKVCKEVMV